MRKTVVFLITGLFIFTPEFSSASSLDNSVTMNVKKETGKGRKKKSGRYVRKKGFMWGLFKRKSQCDCPKH